MAGQSDYAGGNPEDPNKYKAEHGFWVAAEARWFHQQADAKQLTLGKFVDDAIVAIERDNPRRRPARRLRPPWPRQALEELRFSG